MKDIVINEVRGFFVEHYGHISLDQITDGFILEFLSQGYLKGLPFGRKMDCLYDHILAQDLCDVAE